MNEGKTKILRLIRRCQEAHSEKGKEGESFDSSCWTLHLTREIEVELMGDEWPGEVLDVMLHDGIRSAFARILSDVLFGHPVEWDAERLRLQSDNLTVFLPDEEEPKHNPADAPLSIGEKMLWASVFVSEKYSLGEETAANTASTAVYSLRMSHLKLATPWGREMLRQMLNDDG